MIEQEIESLLDNLNIIYDKETDTADRNFKRYKFSIKDDEGEILIATKNKIYMSAGFYDARVICNENYEFISALKKLERLLQERMK